MPYLGNTPAEAYTSMPKQTITGNGGASYTLDHAVANEQEIEVFVNNVRQEPSVAYTVSGTSLTMTGDVESSDDFYVVFQGKSLQTVTPPADSVTTDMIKNDAVTAAKVDSTLHLSTIKDSAGTNTAISIDSNGVVTRSVIPAWRLTAVHDDRTASGSTSVEWSNTTDSESTDNRRFLLGGCTLGGTSPTNHEITVPVTGLYQVNVNMRVDEVGSGYVFMVVQVNNSNVIDAYSIEGSPSGSYQTMTISEVIYVRANDTVQVQVGTQSDTSYEIDGNSTFSGALIG